MQTKQQIQQLLTSAGIGPNKHLGQHFLIDLNLMEKLVDSANIRHDDIVLEVGCGTGSLTQALSQHAGRIIAVEINKTLAEIAKGQLLKTKNVEIIYSDILTNKNTINPDITSALELARKKHAGRTILVANLPYRVGCPVMMNLVKGPTTVEGMYVTVQKEVAERMTATPGNKLYGPLSIFLSAAGEVKTERRLKPTVFWPKPQVDSAMVAFLRRENKARRISDMELFSNVVSLFMQHRRKMLKGCTKFAQNKLTKVNNWHEIFETCSINPHNRPEQLPPEDYIAIANLCYEYIKTR